MNPTVIDKKMKENSNYINHKNNNASLIMHLNDIK